MTPISKSHSETDIDRATNHRRLLYGLRSGSIIRVKSKFRHFVQLSINRPIRYIKDHWQGNLSRPISFYVNGLVSALIVAVLTIYVDDKLYFADIPQGWWTISNSIVFCIAIMLSVWSLVGMLRSAGNFLEKGDNTRWALTAQLLTIIGTLAVLMQSNEKVQQIAVSTLLYFGHDPIGDPATLNVDGNNLHIDGLITDQVAATFKALIDTHPEVTQISMFSGGGRLDAAEVIASIISKRKLNTLVVQECSSACTIIFLSGKIRIFDIGSKLGFHGPRALGRSDVESQNSSSEMYDAYEGVGSSSAFIDQALKTPPSSIWYPSDETLIRQRAVNLFTKARIKQEHEQEIENLRTNGPLKIDKLTKVVSAKVENNSITYTYVIAGRSDEVDWDSMVVMAKYDANALICRNAVSHLLVKSGASYTYLYVDERGQKIGSVVIDKCYNTV